MTLYRRLTLVAEAGRIVKAFYPVFPPDRDADGVLAWLAKNDGGGRNRTGVRGRSARVSTGLAGALVSSPGSAPAGTAEDQALCRCPLADGTIRPGKPAF